METQTSALSRLMKDGAVNVVPDLVRNAEALLGVLVVMLQVISLQVFEVATLWLAVMQVIMSEIIANVAEETASHHNE